MKQLQYTADDSQGTRHEGEVAADSADAARAKLEQEGFQVVVLKEVNGDRKETAPKLSDRESEDVVLAVAELSSAELPLAEGLRAAAAESANKRVGRSLRAIAADVEAGYALESIMTDRGQFLPPHVRGLVAAATRTGRLGLALDDLIEHHRATREAWANVLGAIAYPTIVLGMTVAVVAFLPLYVVPQFKAMFEEFGLELPGLTKSVIRVSDALLWVWNGPGFWGIALAIGVVACLFALASFGRGSPTSHRITTTMPLFGPIWHWGGAVAFSRLLATLLKYDVPLPDALRLTSDGVRDPDVCQLAKMFALGVENGQLLSDLLQESKRLPATMIPFVRWGERNGQLPDTLEAVAEMLQTRIQMRTSLLRSISPPIVFIAVGLLVGFMLISLFLPLVTLVQGLM